jgi:hypothetical protein
MCCFTARPFGGPGRGVHYTHSGVTETGQCPLCGLRLLTYHILSSNLAFRGAGRKRQDGWRLWMGDLGNGECGSTSSSSVLHLIAVWIRNDFKYLIQRQEISPFYMRCLTMFPFAAEINTPYPLKDALATVCGIICNLVIGNFLSPSFRASTCPLHEPKWFYDLNCQSICEMGEWPNCAVRFKNLCHLWPVKGPSCFSVKTLCRPKSQEGTSCVSKWTC